ncbi:MAG: C-GCAxxG-C-C family protein [Peptococcaceae bacterium]|jgi:hypothetical protein|nr:C-GCAxxG-C-C family protein [Peptococcaceae bacterium]
MGKDTQDVRQLMSEGKSCSQVMIQMSMRKLGIEDEHLIRAARGLSMGMGIRHACGILTGIACGMSLADERLGYNIMFPELFKWFYETYGDDHGGVLCAELMDGDDGNRRLRCPEMIDKTWEKACEILEDNGFGG